MSILKEMLGKGMSKASELINKVPVSEIKTLAKVYSNRVERANSVVNMKEHKQVDTLPSLGNNLQSDNQMIDEMRSFNRFRLGQYIEPHITGQGYLFFISPSLSFNDLKGINRDNNLGLYISKTMEISPYITEQLVGQNIFIPLLSNRFKSFDPTDVNFKTIASHETFYGYKMQVVGSNVESVTANTCNVTYIEDSNLSVTTMHKVWTDYMHLSRRGYISGNDDCIGREEIDYMSSLYYFALQPDGETISYYCRLTGICPINIPYSSFGTKVGETTVNTDISFTYSYVFKEDMEPVILSDFKRLSGGSGVTIDIVSSNRTDTGKPSKNYKLKFSEYPNNYMH
jgi:hypothetical protein